MAKDSKKSTLEILKPTLYLRLKLEERLII
jgi:hypothetical protein